MTDSYVPQVGDVVEGYHYIIGIYLGEQSGRGSGRHVILGEDGQNCTVVEGVHLPHAAMKFSGDSWRTDSVADEGARLLAQICESLEDPAPVSQTPTYRVPAASAFGMTTEMAAWWAKVRPRMAKVAFVDAWLKIKTARDNIAAIERIGGLPGIEMQERADAAEYELAARRKRVLYVFADQIAAMRKQYKIEEEAT